MTNLFVLNKDLVPVYVVDEFEQLIWTTRYNQLGDFELTLPVLDSHLENLQKEFYIRYEDDPELMIIDDVEINTDDEEGHNLFITGRDVGSILDRRVVFPQVMLNGTVASSVASLLNTHIINPSLAARRWDQLSFTNLTDPSLGDIRVEAQYTGDGLDSAIIDLCLVTDLGFQVRTLGSGFEFVLFSGRDLTGADPNNHVVLFSPEYENLSNSNFFTSDRLYKTVTIVAGEGEGADRKHITVYDPNIASTTSGIDRRESFTDARDISSSVEDRTLTRTEYNNLLKQRGLEKLAEQKIATLFDGEAEVAQMFQYGVDFYIGDVVLIQNEYGMRGASRITEYIRSEGPGGKLSYPTFTSI